MPPGPPHRLDICAPELPSPGVPMPTFSEHQMQNGNAANHFHSISLRSPGDQPVVLSFDGHGSIGNGSIGILHGDKSPAEGNSQGQLIADSPKCPPSKLHALGRLLVSRRFLLALVGLLSLVALVLIASLVLVILKWGAEKQQLEDAEFLNRDSSWRGGCERKCSAKFDVPPLLLISMDGFRADYLQRNKTASVSRIMQCGAKAEYMLPSYPSKTFPNHYSIVTGLYPESHGIVDNHFYDEDMPDEKNFAKSSRNPTWYNGEPIWNTVTKNGKKSAIFFWPGSEVPIQGMLPTFRYDYNASLPFSKRVDQVIDWLRLDEADRPAFLAMYFEQPDTAMHREGPDSDAVNSALIYVDAMINYLMQQLDNNGLLGCINLVILSDHGAQKLREDHFVALDQYVNAREPEVGGVFGGTIGHINFRASASQVFIDRVLAPMSCLGGQTFRVYTRESMPKRYHYAKSGRIGEIVIDAVGGSRVFVDARSLREHGPQEKGDHGYDNRMREMRAIFGAWGPSVKSGHVEKAFQNIELYNLFTALMQLPVSAPNNGTVGRLNPLLRSPSPFESTPTMELGECEGARLLKCGDGCHFELNYQYGSVSMPSPSDGSSTSNNPTVPVYNGQHCKFADRVQVPAQLASQGRHCLIRLCNATLVFNRRLRLPNFVESQLSAPIPNIDHRANCSGHFVVPKAPLRTTIAAGEQTGTTEEFGQENGSTGSPVKRSQDRQEDGENVQSKAHDEDSHMVSDPTLGGGQMEDTTAPWARPAEMEDISVQATGMATNSTSASPAAGPQMPTKSPAQLECLRLSGQSQATADPNSRISLFSDNDYARYIVQGQFRVPPGFLTGPWKQILSLIRQYVQHYKRLLMWSGPVYDHNHDGLADQLLAENGLAELPDDSQLPPPSHIFLIFLRCSNNTWASEGRNCEEAKKTKTLAFVLPLVEKDLNCLFPVEYIFRHTASIRDIELLTGNEWFLDRQIYPPELAIRLRTQLNEELWQLELKS